MSFYKLIKISILLGTGLIVACSSNDADTKTSVTKQVIYPNALTATIDPKTGEFIDKPAPVQSNNITTSSTQKIATPKFTEMKESTSPAGGSYIEAIGVVKKKNN